VDVIHALGFGAKSVVGAELNPATYSLARNDYADYMGHVLDNKKVTLVNSEGRSALRSLNHKVDIVFLNAIDTFAALSAGAYVLSENYLYTVESMQEMLSHLNTNGLIAFSRWNTNPPRESLRLSSLFCETLRRSGCQTVDKQIFIVAQPCGEGGRLFSKTTDFGWAVSLFKKNPFTKEEVQMLAHQAGIHGLRVLFFPKVYGQEEQAKMEADYAQANQADPDFGENSGCFNRLIAAYSQGEQQKFFASYPFEVTPTTDDSPFFFEYPLKNKFGLPDLFELKRTSAGMAICVVIVESIVFSLLAIFWPLWKYQKGGIKVRFSPQFSVYFSAVGIGFMLIEIGLVQKFVLFLGSPLYALSIVLASLLLSAGLGSAVLSATNWSWRKTVAVFGSSLVFLLLVLVFGLNTLFYSLLYLDLPVKMAIAFSVIFPVGFLMGTFFPSGLEAIKKNNPDYVPWAWGINGCTSVFGSIAAIALAMSKGFTFSLLIGVMAYLVACLSVYAIPKKLDS